MSDLYYPDRHDIFDWARYVSQMQLLDQYMPEVDYQWAEKIESCFHTTRLCPDKNDLCASAARVFYKIIQNHYFVDGNKRSAVINTYLFVLGNGYRLNIPADQLYDLSKKVANEKEGSEKEIKSLRSIFSRYSERKK